MSALPKKISGDDFIPLGHSAGGTVKVQQRFVFAYFYLLNFTTSRASDTRHCVDLSECPLCVCVCVALSHFAVYTENSGFIER